MRSFFFSRFYLLKSEGVVFGRKMMRVCYGFVFSGNISVSLWLSLSKIFGLLLCYLSLDKIFLSRCRFLCPIYILPEFKSLSKYFDLISKYTDLRIDLVVLAIKDDYEDLFYFWLESVIVILVIFVINE